MQATLNVTVRQPTELAKKGVAWRTSKWRHETDTNLFHLVTWVVTS